MLYRNLLLLIAIAAGASALAVASYQYYNFTTKKIIEISEQDVHSNAQIETYAISNALTGKIADIDNNLKLLASSPVVQQGDLRAQQLFDATQATSAVLTDGYYWLNENGFIITYSEFNTRKFPDYRGDDLSYREYFSVPRETLEPFASTTLDSVDGVPRMYLSQPIINTQTGQFSGVMVASISTKNAGAFMQSQLLPEYRSNVGLTDKTGLILYTNNQSLIGTYYYEDKFQSMLPELVRPQFNALLERAIAGESGMGDIIYLGPPTTISYQPVTVNSEHLWTAYIIYPHTQTSDVIFLLDQQRNFSITITAAIGIVATLIAYLVLTSNRRLGLMVRQKTSELRQAVDSLARANDQLKEHDRMQREFINIAAHELRTPIQPILGITELKESELDGRDELTISRDDMELLVRNAKRLEKLSSDILQVTRIESRSLALSKEIFDLNQKVRNVVADAQNTSGKKIEFVVELPEPSIMVIADKPKIYEVISNLLGNAVKFTREGKITISAYTTMDGMAVVNVKDTGTGIDPEIMPRLFTKFASKSEQGTGLGLFIAKSIVEAHGGKIRGENHPAGGAIFTVTLPLAKEK
ncbi:MAG: sensor histidine kinase [Thermoproteota archaeon]